MQKNQRKKKQNVPGFPTPLLSYAPTFLRPQKGQSLIELVIGIAIGILLIAGAVGIIVLTLRISGQNKASQTATELTHELANQIPILANNNWHAVFDISPHSTSTQRHLAQTGGFLAVATGTEEINVNDQSFTRSFSVADVERDADGAIVTDGSGTVDPSTLAVLITTSWVQAGDTADVTFTQYIARNRSRIFNQTDWSAGPGFDGPFTSPPSGFSSMVNTAYASIPGAIFIDSLSGMIATTTTNIHPVNKWAWNDVIGWVDFNITGTVTISTTTMRGYASSGVGYIALDCATSPTHNCTHPYGVDNDGDGELSGYAWNDAIGWISFRSVGGPSYGVNVSTSTGDFSGWAWNDVVGWFSFSCANLSECASSYYKVITLWGSSTVSTATLTSSIFDTQIAGGAGLNTIMWQGTKPTGTNVKFQIAGSNSSLGPWDFLGPDGTATTYYDPAGASVQMKINRSVHNDYRYIRYEVTLESDFDKTFSPLVTDIIIGWSP